MLLESMLGPEIGNEKFVERPKLYVSSTYHKLVSKILKKLNKS